MPVGGSDICVNILLRTGIELDWLQEAQSDRNHLTDPSWQTCNHPLHPFPALSTPFPPSPPPFHPKTPSSPTHVPMTPLMWERSQEISRSQKERRCRMILRWLQHSCVELSWVTRLPPWGLLRHRSRRFKSVQQGSLIPSTGFTSGLKLFDAEGKGQMGCW